MSSPASMQKLGRATVAAWARRVGARRRLAALQGLQGKCRSGDANGRTERDPLGTVDSRRAAVRRAAALSKTANAGPNHSCCDMKWSV